MGRAWAEDALWALLRRGFERVLRPPFRQESAAAEGSMC